MEQEDLERYHDLLLDTDFHEGYNPYAIPADIDLARQHESANSIGTHKEDHDEQRCPCCA